MANINIMKLLQSPGWSGLNNAERMVYLATIAMADHDGVARCSDPFIASIAQSEEVSYPGDIHNLIDVGVIQREDDGLRVVQWELFGSQAKSNAERQKAYRARKAAQKGGSDVR